MHSLFILGQLHVTDEAAKLLGRSPMDLIARHAVADWGLVGPELFFANRTSHATAGQIESIYHADPTDKRKGVVHVVTTEGWGETIVMTSPQRKKYEKGETPF